MIMIDRREKARTPALRRKKDTERGDGAFAFCDSIQRITSHFNHATSESVGRPSLRPEVLEERPVFDQSSPSGPLRSESTLVPIRPRSRCERRSLRTPAVSAPLRSSKEAEAARGGGPSAPRLFPSPPPQAAASKESESVFSSIDRPSQSSIDQCAAVTMAFTLAIACAGFNDLGHTLEQFMIV